MANDNPARRFGKLDARELERVVVVSPHLDDAVLSCGRFLAMHPGTVVVTMFAASPERYTDPLNEWDTQCGFAPGDDTMAIRRAEDTAAMAMLGAQPVWLDFHQNSHVPRAGDGAVWPDGVLGALARAIGAYDPTAVIAPLGLWHPDHVCCSQVALALRDDVASGGERLPSWFAYEDHPYRVMPSVLASRLAAIARRGLVLTPVPVPTDDTDQRSWAAFECYTTQWRHLDDDWDLVARRGEPERYWRVESRDAYASLVP